MLIDAELLLNFQRCSRRAFLDQHGDLAQRDPPNDYVLKLIQDSQNNQGLVLENYTVHWPAHVAGDWEAAAVSTIDLMRQGVECIWQGIVLTEGPEGVTLRSHPDLLIKRSGVSIFGDWLYEPIDIKLGKRPKLEYQILAAFHVYVLAQVQGGWPETATLILRERGDYLVDLWQVLPAMQEILADCIRTLQRREEPEVFISRNRCSLCHWFSHCYEVAKTDFHLSLLPGVTPVRYQQLQELNLTTVESLANMNPVALTPLAGFGSEVAHKLVRQARSVVQNQAILATEALDLELTYWSSQRWNYTTFPTNELPTSSVELYFDIEAEPSLKLVYLHGVLVVDRVAKTEVFHSFVAESPEAEPLVWQQFLDLVWAYPHAPIFHFCPFEVQTVERLANLYKTPRHQIQPLLTRFVDLHERVTRYVTLPVESYALKHIARWLGFDWRTPSANGAQSIYWYAQWLSTGDRTYLEAILTYNEDDCRATYRVKEWLVQFLQGYPQVALA
ncbi:MAG: TM0106 family RecB-like putative nuclease [Leptolyngbyaceae cyanobacterium]